MMKKYSKIVPVLFAVCGIYSASAQTLPVSSATSENGSSVPYSDLTTPSKTVKKFVVTDTTIPKPTMTVCGAISCYFLPNQWMCSGGHKAIC